MLVKHCILKGKFKTMLTLKYKKMCFLNIFDMKTLYTKTMWKRTPIKKNSRECLDRNKPGHKNKQIRGRIHYIEIIYMNV